MAQIRRRKSVTATVGNVRVGGDVPVVVQSMTNTDTADIEGTILQVAQLARAGSEMVARDREQDAAAKAVPVRILWKGWQNKNVHVPIIGDFHIQRASAAHPLSRVRAGAGQVPHQFPAT